MSHFGPASAWQWSEGASSRHALACLSARVEKGMHCHQRWPTEVPVCEADLAFNAPHPRATRSFWTKNQSGSCSSGPALPAGHTLVPLISFTVPSPALVCNRECLTEVAAESRPVSALPGLEPSCQGSRDDWQLQGVSSRLPRSLPARGPGPRT